MPQDLSTYGASAGEQHVFDLEAFDAYVRGLPGRPASPGFAAVEVRRDIMTAAVAGEVRVPIHSADDIVVGRQQGRALASLVGFSSSNLTVIAAAISEVARNIVEHAREGELAITVIDDGNRRGVKIVAADQGPGIADVAAVMRDGFSTGRGLGIGLPGARRLMDEFEITSEIDRGTTVTMKKWL